MVHYIDKILLILLLIVIYYYMLQYILLYIHTYICYYAMVNRICEKVYILYILLYKRRYDIYETLAAAFDLLIALRRFSRHIFIAAADYFITVPLLLRRRHYVIISSTYFIRDTIIAARCRVTSATSVTSHASGRSPATSFMMCARHICRCHC